MTDLLKYLNRVRQNQELLTISEIIGLSDRGNVIYDPVSVLISRHAEIGADNVFMPGVYLFCLPENGRLVIGDKNIFHANTLLEASQGEVRIGSLNQFGEGGFSAKANRSGASITIGDNGRYLNGAAVYGTSLLGSGSQLLGAITADSCILEGGGSYRDADPDIRAGLLKGAGIARGITVPIGQVIVGAGTFSAADLQPQSNFHPKTPS